MPSAASFLTAVVLALGIAAAGWLVGEGFERGRAADRFVTVKGVAERPVRADLAVWPLGVVASDADLAVAHQELEASLSALRAFLADKGIAAEQVHFQGLTVSDNLANPYGGDRNADRYVLRQTLIVRSEEPLVVQAASADVADLLSAGVVLQGIHPHEPVHPLYLFTRLNDLKPEMIAEATARAREAAEQFASDSSTRLGAIRRANQGVFQILPRDEVQGIAEAQQLDKVVRVVSTVEWSLED